jgi:hypothetical protein
MKTLESVLSEYRADAQVLRRYGATHIADVIDRILKDVESASEDFMRFISEPDAMMRSGRGIDFLRARFPAWERDGNARYERRQRFYRQVVVEHRLDLEAAREAGRIAGGVSRPRA